MKQVSGWLAVCLCLLVSAAGIRAGEPIEEGILDRIVLHAEKAPGGVPVVVRLFDSSKADLGTGAEGGKEKHVAAAKIFQEQAPGILADSLVEELGEKGSFGEVSLASGGEVPADAIVIEGRFTVLDPGSRAKRYFAGFGAGKGIIEIEGTVESAGGETLAEFAHRRVAVMGVGGGDYERKMRADCERLGEDLAEFLDTWSRGKSLD